MKYLFTCTLLIITVTLFAQITAITQDGKTVSLFPNGTWQYKSDDGQSKDAFTGSWFREGYGKIIITKDGATYWVRRIAQTANQNSWEANGTLQDNLIHVGVYGSLSMQNGKLHFGGLSYDKIEDVEKAIVPPATTMQEDERPELVKQKLAERIARESQGTLSLTNFTKTNGYEQEAYGMKHYTMEFTAVITPNRFCIIQGNAFQGYFQNFSVVLNEPTDGWGRTELGNAKRVQSGQRIQLICKTSMVKKENGWEVGSTTIVSYSF